MHKPRSYKVLSSAGTDVPLAELASAAAEAAALLKALANPDRLLLLCNLVDGECNVSALENVTGICQPTLSQQLGVLRDEGLVETRREGKFIFYRIASAPAMAVLHTLYQTFCHPVKTASRKRRPATTQEPSR
jgi:ArsR family transcriptional regulator